MQNVCTLGACQTIKEAAESKCDERMLHILRGVNNYLIAAEAKYHKSCFASNQISSTRPFEKKMESHCITKHFKG